MADFTPFETAASAGELSLRWFTGNCYEIKLPSGKTVVTDPFLPHPDEEITLWAKNYCGYTAESLEGCDYAIIGHSHGDHLGSIAEVFDRFTPLVLAHRSYAIELTTKLLIPQMLVFPFDNNQHYEFTDFTLDTCIGRHLYGELLRNGPAKLLTELKVPGKGTAYETMDIYGGMFNTDWILTTTNNVRIGFCTGPFADWQRNRWKNAGINILLRQCGFEIRTNNYKAIAKDLMDTGAELLLPLHHEHMYDQEDCVAFSQRVNEELALNDYKGRMFIPERAQWYTIGKNISLR